MSNPRTGTHIEVRYGSNDIEWPNGDVFNVERYAELAVAALQAAYPDADVDSERYHTPQEAGWVDVRAWVDGPGGARVRDESIESDAEAHFPEVCDMPDDEGWIEPESEEDSDQ